MTATRTNSTSASVSWTGSGASYSFFMGVDETTVTSECPNGTSGSGPSFCNYAETAITPPFAAAGLTPDTTYYIKVVDNSGSCESLVTPYLSSCLAPPLFLTEGGPSDDLYVFETGSVAQKVTSATFSKTDTQGTNVTSITSPDNTTANGISSTVTPLNPGTSLVDYDVFFSSTLACSDSSQVRVSPPSAWWQVIDSDVMSYSAIGSSVPTSDDFFGLPGIGGYPGVPAAPSLSFGNGSASENFNWQAQTGVSAQRIFNYDYFDGIKPSDITLNDFALGIEGGGIITGDYYWFKNTGPLVLPATNIASRKVVLFVDGDLNITGDISLTDAFLMIIVSGNVTINPDVASLEGLFVANGTISTGTNGAGADAVPGLYVRGALASYGGLSLDRDLVDNSGPAHQFEYAPDLILLFPRELSNRKINWKEVAP
ncbi:MAG TPA: hypothetical protein VJ227_03740 [Patescibacteria group bacterium]|nr:hypothetical protein [Patescibacteria group bacterium]